MRRPAHQGISGGLLSQEPHQPWSSIAGEPRMEGCFWKALLVVGALTIGGGSSLPHKPLTFEEAVDLAVNIYNNRSEEESLYRLLEPVSPTEWDPLSESKQELNFTLMETVCQVAKEPSLEQCDFREDGAVKECRAYYLFGESLPLLVLTCEPVDEEEEEKEKEVEKEEKEEEGDEEEKEEEKKEKEGDKKGPPRRVKRFKKFWRKIKKSLKKRAKKFLKKPTIIGVSIPF